MSGPCRSWGGDVASESLPWELEGQVTLRVGELEMEVSLAVEAVEMWVSLT
jgi:hypothetical protein